MSTRRERDVAMILVGMAVGFRLFGYHESPERTRRGEQ
jgi:hypothetical protein